MLRRLGARLLSRLSESAARLRSGISGSLVELGVRGKEPGQREIRPSTVAVRPLLHSALGYAEPRQSYTLAPKHGRPRQDAKNQICPKFRRQTLGDPWCTRDAAQVR